MAAAPRTIRWFAFWTLLGLLASAQAHFAHQRFAADPHPWSQALESALPEWYLWGLLSPVVAWLARRFQVDRANFGRHFFIHLGASLDIALLHVLGAVTVQNALHAWRGEAFPFAQRLVDNFTVFFHWDVVIYWTILAVVHALDYHRDAELRRGHAAELEAQLRALMGGASGVEARGPRPRYSDRLLVADDGRSFFLRTADVHWFETARNYVRVHAGDRVHILRTTLVSLEGRLDPERFRRISRSAVVNLDRVREVQPWFHGDAVVILENGARLPLSRRYRANLLGEPVS
ncbi:MAG TPA: LytTR family DNA-binding domain-containing protein [Gemmatimonadales bacterium]|nr:LytTR family DNA-binding domain-containing protein [Gemmatimonadales bacterium]